MIEGNTMENKELENVIEASWESRDEINEKTVGITKEAVEQTFLSWRYYIYMTIKGQGSFEA